ncbi:MAG: N-acetylneuraminate synthase family protein [Chloroflexota bacterium]
MHRHTNWKRPYIISEIHPQHSGEMRDAKAMILQSHMAGADAVKVQIYDTQKLHGNQIRSYVELTKDELAELKAYAEMLGIDFFGSVFNLDRVDWCEELGFTHYKIASRSVEDRELCEKIIGIGKPTIISLGMWDWESKGIPYQGDHLSYLYCVAQYPTFLEDVAMPNFSDSFFDGYSDHTLSVGACLYAISRGATILEKHFTLNKGRQRSTEKGHAGGMDFDELKQLRQLADDISWVRGFAES